MKDFSKLYKEIKEKTRRYNLGDKGIEKELIELHKEVLNQIPELQDKTERNLRVLMRGGI